MNSTNHPPLPTEDTATAASPPAESLQSESPSAESLPAEPQPSYVKLAMRNMVRKRGKSLQHFVVTAIALLSVLVGLSYLTR